MIYPEERFKTEMNDLYYYSAKVAILIKNEDTGYQLKYPVSSK
jgi:hypothetical protein